MIEGKLYVVTSYSGQMFVGRYGCSNENMIVLNDAFEIIEQSIMTQQGIMKAKTLSAVIPGYDRVVSVTTTVSSFIELPEGSNVEANYFKTKAELSGIHLASTVELGAIEKTGKLVL